jgi:hypothetical protein
MGTSRVIVCVFDLWFVQAAFEPGAGARLNGSITGSSIVLLLLELLLFVLLLELLSAVVITRPGGLKDNCEFRGELGVDNGVAPGIMEKATKE